MTHDDAAQPSWQIKIVGHEVVPASRLRENPLNFRVHGTQQQHAMTAALDEIGWVDEVLVNRRTLTIIDGHLRVALATAADGAHAPVPVAWCDLDDQQELLALRTINPIAAMAWTDRDQQAALHREIREADERDLQLLSLLHPAGLPEDLPPVVLPLDHQPAGGDDDARARPARPEPAPEPPALPEEPSAAADPLPPEERLEAPVTPAGLAALASVTVADPAQPVARGEIWDLGEHVLCCLDVISDWPIWLPELRRGAGQAGAPTTLCAPYAGPFAVLGAPRGQRLVLIQPDPYLAGQVLAAYSGVRGAAAVAKRASSRRARSALPAGGPEHSRWRQRIVGHAVVPADQLTANPLNWRIHGALQQQAMGAALETLGWLDEVLVNLRTGYVLDGHLRVALALRLQGDTAPIPVAYVDLDEREEKLALASFNPLGELAETDPAQLARLNGAIGAPDLLTSELLALLDTTAGGLPEQIGTDGEASGLGATQELPRGAGALLARVDVSTRPPRHQVRPGEIWDVGDHVLACVDVLRDWPIWAPLLADDGAQAAAGRPTRGNTRHGTLFAPYPGPFSALALKARTNRLVLVQPDPYLAGHLLDTVVAAKATDGAMRVPPRRRAGPEAA